jgi:hypothetical protein
MIMIMMINRIYQRIVSVFRVVVVEMFFIFDGECHFSCRTRTQQTGHARDGPRAGGEGARAQPSHSLQIDCENATITNKQDGGDDRKMIGMHTSS